MSQFHQLPTVGPEQWRSMYRRALAAGCGRVIDLEDERLAAPDELVALALPGLVRLGAVALRADGASDPSPECARALAREAAGVLRLLDRALAAHGATTAIELRHGSSTRSAPPRRPPACPGSRWTRCP